MSNKRIKNKAKRRSQIVREARKLLSDKDADSFSLRNLADAAGVTVPTIYNLVGSKADLLSELYMGFVDRLEAAVSDSGDALEAVENIVGITLDISHRDPQISRAALISLDYLHRSHEHLPLMRLAARRAMNLVINAVQLAADEGLLEGDIPVELISSQIVRIHGSVSLDWAFRRCSEEDYRRRALLGTYLALAADANPVFKHRLLTRITGLREDLTNLAESL